MSDNTSLNPGAAGDLIATDELTTINGAAATFGLKVQRTKVGFGTDGVFTDASAINPLPTQDVATGQFGELRTVEKTPVIELSSSYGLSAYRDTVTLVSAGTATNVAGENCLSISGPTDSATLDSAERGRYMPGYSAEIGVGLRLPVAPVGNQVVIWGYSDAADGFYFGHDATGLYVARLAGGVETRVRQVNWNGDKLDGSGVSGQTLTMSRGNIFQIVFSWYGYGAIEFIVVRTDVMGRQRSVIVHRMAVDGSTSIQQPNLPVRVKVANNGTTAALNTYVGGRQFSVIGRYIPNERLTTVNRLSLAAIGTTSLPMLSVRHKPAFVSVPVRVAFVELVSDGSAMLEVYLNASLTGPSFGVIPKISAAETALEMSISATAITGGNLIYSSLISATGSGVSRSGSSGTRGLSIYIPALLPVTVAIRAITGTVTASVLVGMQEDW